MPQAAKMMASKGRNGDTTVGHLTPGEIIIPRDLIDNQPQLMAAIIKAFSKYGENVGEPMDWRRYVVGDPSGPTNPETGAEEFFGPSAGSRTTGGGAAFGGVQRDSPDRMSRGGPSAGAGRAIDMSRDNPFDSMDRMTTESDPTKGLRGVSVSDAGGFSLGNLGAETSSGGRGRVNALTDMLSLPTTEEGWVEAGLRAIPGIGTAISAVDAFQNATGIMGTPGSPEDAGRGGRSDVGRIGPVRSVSAPVSRATAFARPGMVGIPSGLDLSPAMSDLQQRTAIATRALYGDESMYRSDEAKDYYKNLLQRTLIGANGQPGDFGQIMPIESQYLQQVLGLSYQPTTQSVLNAIAAA